MLKLVAEGKDNAEIAAELFISPKTVKNHISNILMKLQISNRIQAAVYAVRRGMSRRLLAIAVALALVSVAAPAQAASPKTLARFVSASGLSGSASVSVVRLDGSPVYEFKGNRTRIPASNEKLVTAVAALSELGAATRVHTAVAAVGEPSGAGTVHGSLYLVGGGDPTLASGDITRLARAVRAAGIKRVTGSIVGDETLWDARRDAPGWKSGFLGEECPPLSALTLARNPSGRSATRAAAALLRALRKAGVRVWAPSAPAGRRPVPHRSPSTHRRASTRCCARWARSPTTSPPRCC